MILPYGNSHPQFRPRTVRFSSNSDPEMDYTDEQNQSPSNKFEAEVIEVPDPLSCRRIESVVNKEAIAENGYLSPSYFFIETNSYNCHSNTCLWIKPMVAQSSDKFYIKTKESWKKKLVLEYCPTHNFYPHSRMDRIRLLIIIDTLTDRLTKYLVFDKIATLEFVQSSDKTTQFYFHKEELAEHILNR